MNLLLVVERTNHLPAEKTKLSKRKAKKRIVKPALKYQAAALLLFTVTLAQSSEYPTSSYPEALRWGGMLLPASWARVMCSWVTPTRNIKSQHF